jgi:hypothetical protein
LHYVVRTPQTESDLTPLTGQKWRDLQQAAGFELIDPRETSVASAVAAERSGKELWGSLLAVVLAMGIAEMFIARAWSREGA